MTRLEPRDEPAPTAPRPERKATLRLNQRHLVRIQIAFIIPVVLALLWGAYRVFLPFKAHRDVVIAQANLHTLYQAMRSYSEDWDNRLPPAEDWEDKVRGYLSAPRNSPGGKYGALSGPGDGATIGYVCNELAGNYNLDPTGAELKTQRANPQDLVLLIERPGAGENAHISIPPQTNAQAEEALYNALTFPHYSDDTANATAVVLFADGSVRQMRRSDFTHESVRK